MIQRLSCCGLLGLLAACASTIDRRVDVDAPDEVGGAVLQSQDIRTIADRMARDITASGVLTAAQPGERISFYVINMENESSDVLNKSIMLNKIETELYNSLKGRVQILDRSAVGLDAVRREREAKRSGAVAGKESMKQSVAGSDYALTGVIQDRVQQSGKLKSVYYLVTFRLVNLESDEIVWKGDYDTKFLSEKPVISR
jgi:PBP1b-binding outer membrane lipoprotein LpoB